MPRAHVYVLILFLLLFHALTRLRDDTSMIRINGLIFLALSLLCISAISTYSEEPPTAGDSDVLDRIESNTDRWMETQLRITEAKSRWKEERELLQHSVSVLEREQESLRERVEGYKFAESLYENTRRNVSEALNEHQTSNAQIEAKLHQFERRIQQLARRLPAPLRESMETQLRMLETGQTSNEAKVSNRSQNLISLLSKIEHFSNSLTLTHRVRRADDGSEFDVRILYWGVAFAYACDAHGERGWLLRPTGEGWEWTDQHDKSADIKAIIDVYEKKREPDLIALPAYLD